MANDIPNKVTNRGTIARLAIQCTCPDSGAIGCFLFTGDSHRTPGMRCTPVMDQVELYKYVKAQGWKEVSQGQRPAGSIAAYTYEP